MWICDCCSELNNDKSKKCCYCGLKKTVRGRDDSSKRRKVKARTPWYAYAASVAAFAMVLTVGLFLLKFRLSNADGGEKLTQETTSADSASAARSGSAQRTAPVSGVSDKTENNESGAKRNTAPQTQGDAADAEADDWADYYADEDFDYTGGWGIDKPSDVVVYEQNGQAISFIVVSCNSTATKIASADIRNVELHNGSGSFRYADSWGNTGSGTVSFDGDTMELSMVEEYLNNSNWSAAQASGTYTKFTDIIDQDMLASFYGEGVAETSEYSKYGYISETLFPLSDGEYTVQVVNVTSGANGTNIEVFKLTPVVFREENLKNYSVGSAIDVGDMQWIVEYIDPIDQSWYLSGGTFVKASDGLWHATYASDVSVYSRSVAAYSVKEPKDGSAVIIDNTNLLKEQLSSAYDLFCKYGEFKAKITVKDFAITYMEKVYSP